MSKPRIAFLFSGQGSHYFQMGLELYEGNAAFRYWMDRLDVEHRTLQGSYVVDQLYRLGHKPSDCFDQLQLTHPAIFNVEYALARALIEAGVTPEVVAGASLGTFAAAAVAGVLRVEETLAAVVEHAQVVQRSCEVGCMIAVLAPVSVFYASGMDFYSELAAVNTGSHFVISLAASALEPIERTLIELSVAYHKLPVSFAFHSRWIEGSKTFIGWCRGLSFRSPRVPLLCCAQARFLTSMCAEDLWHATRMPVRFQDSILQLERSGSWHYVDAGPAGTLGTFIKYISPVADQSLRIHRILSPFGGDRENLTKVVAMLCVAPS